MSSRKVKKAKNMPSRRSNISITENQVLQALNEIAVPVCERRIIRQIADTTGGRPGQIKMAVRESIQAGISSGTIKRQNRRYSAILSPETVAVPPTRSMPSLVALPPRVANDLDVEMPPVPRAQMQVSPFDEELARALFGTVLIRPRLSPISARQETVRPNTPISMDSEDLDTPADTPINLSFQSDESFPSTATPASLIQDPRTMPLRRSIRIANRLNRPFVPAAPLRSRQPTRGTLRLRMDPPVKLRRSPRTRRAFLHGNFRTALEAFISPRWDTPHLTRVPYHSHSRDQTPESDISEMDP